MTDFLQHKQQLCQILQDQGNQDVADANQRYFPQKIVMIGVSNGEIMRLADAYIQANTQLSVDCRLAIAELLISAATCHEQRLMGFALIRKVVRRHFDDELLQRIEYWLDHYVSNWAECDNLCLKVIYNYFLGHTHLIECIGHWVDSASPWTRRAANVALVKFISRKIGKEVYQLPKEIVFNNCQKLLIDPDTYVQKGIGWLLKVTAMHHRDDVAAFLVQNIHKLHRHTLRYAIEKFPPEQRKQLMRCTE